MPCSDSSSSITLKLDPDERFVSFEFAKITCGREITAETNYSQYCAKKTIQEIISFPFSQVASDLNIEDQETQFILYLEWDALRAALAQYSGRDDENIDRDRCQISSIEHNKKGVEVSLILLPPKELPKILPCNLKRT